MTARPNARLARIGDELAYVLAPLVTSALEHIARELTTADSLPDHTPGAGPVVALPYLERAKCRTCQGKGWYVLADDRIACALTPTELAAGHPAVTAPSDGAIRCDDCDANGTVALTKTERAALKRYELTSSREDIRDLLAAFEQLRDSLRHVCVQAQRTRMPDAPTEKGTCTGDPLAPGYYEPLVDGGWFDPTCQRLSRSVKPGLCDPCRKRLERYADEHGLKPPKDERVVTHDSVLHYDDGVARARPVRGAA